MYTRQRSTLQTYLINPTLFVAVLLSSFLHQPLAYARDGEEDIEIPFLNKSTESVDADTPPSTAPTTLPENLNLPPLTSKQLTRLQKLDAAWNLDDGSAAQITELLNAIQKQNNVLEQSYTPDAFSDILKRRNVTVSTEFGSATRIQLEQADGSKGNLMIVSLKNSNGEPVDIIFVDFNTTSPESVDLQKFIATRMIYEPRDVTKTEFGRSILLVDSDWKDTSTAKAALETEGKSLFFPRGYNLKAWSKATFYKPKWQSFKDSWKPSVIQCGTAFGVCTVGEKIGMSNIPVYIPMALNVIWSSVIGFNFESYCVLNGMGHALKRFTFNFVFTSLSFAIALNLWDKGFDHLTHPEVMMWILINASAGNLVRAALDHRSIMEEETGFRSPKEARINRQITYSYVAQPLRLGDLIVQSLTKTAGGANTFAKAAVKSFYLGLAGTASWVVMRYAETLASEARNNPDFAQKIDLRLINEKSAHLRKNFEELKDKIRKRTSPASVIEFLSGTKMRTFNHKEVDRLFKRWMETKVAYFYRYDRSDLMPASELAKYRRAFVDEMVELAIKSEHVHDFEAPESTKVWSFLNTNAQILRATLEEQKALVEQRSWDENGIRASAEYGAFLTDVIDTTVARLRQADHRVSDDLKARLVGFVYDLVNKFSADATDFDRHFMETSLADRFGVNASKAVEHYESRLTMWRFLYTDHFRAGQLNEFPKEVREDFLAYLNSENLQQLEAWAQVHRSRFEDTMYEHKNLFQKELNEVLSLSRELHRRLTHKLSVNSLRVPLEMKDLSKLKKEMLAFWALRDYQNHFDDRWLPDGAHSTSAPDTFWTYNLGRAGRRPEQYQKKTLIKTLDQWLVSSAKTIAVTYPKMIAKIDDAALVIYKPLAQAKDDARATTGQLLDRAASCQAMIFKVAGRRRASHH